ncbi:hypothetical protein SAMN04489798_2298 [Pseudomonas arsenicoxydans]|uniref:Uncharacterized protein n=1 Tax=Pseudomonas arsenicoxydans TaxID=702115 RepID=A0A1H0HL86_9PSED|nr:hypothetical protein [Pseudomonas arsenicoxydans]SDO19814.1 hypothetical protein SAMN04489798_2298 [Pseudomonas arsenicoxydans]
MASRKPFQIKQRHRKGCCFRLAWLGLMKSTERMVMVHGIVNGPDNTRIPHAWLVGENFYYDVVSDRFFTMDDYIHCFAAELCKVYAKDEAAVLLHTKGHYGPW